MENLISKYFIEDVQRHLWIVLGFFILVLSLQYIYLINGSILNTVNREQNNREISRIVANISELENIYIALKSDINIDMAHSMGFRDDFSKVHFSPESNTVAGNISLLGNEI